MNSTSVILILRWSSIIICSSTWFPQQTFIFQTITSCVNVLSTSCKRTKFCGSLDKIEVPCHSRCGTLPPCHSRCGTLPPCHSRCGRIPPCPKTTSAGQILQSSIGSSKDAIRMKYFPAGCETTNNQTITIIQKTPYDSPHKMD